MAGVIAKTKPGEPGFSQLDNAPSDAHLTPDSIGALIRSRTFGQTATLRTLLVYLWEHRQESVSEYAIAVEALGRAENFDPKFDATVRVQIARLRQRLQRYYEVEGQECTERFVIPLGSHDLRVERVERPIAPEPAPNIEAKPRGGHWIRILGLLCGALFLISAALGIALYRERSMRGKVVQAPTRLWASFFANGRPTRIVLPSPVFVSFPRSDKTGAIMVRDTNVNDFLAYGASPAVNAIERVFGKPHLADNYTVTSDTFAAVRLARYLEGCGLETSLHSSAEAPLAALDNENVIAIGTRGTLNDLKPYLDQTTFRLLPRDSDVENQRPRSGEASQIRMEQESPARSIWPGTMAILPGRAGRTHLMILTARHTSSLVDFLTSANGQDQLDHIWKAQGAPENYEVIINAELNGANLVRCWPVILHRIP
jgi:hypothetical protein